MGESSAKNSGQSSGGQQNRNFGERSEKTSGQSSGEQQNRNFVERSALHSGQGTEGQQNRNFGERSEVNSVTSVSGDSADSGGESSEDRREITNRQTSKKARYSAANQDRNVKGMWCDAAGPGNKSVRLLNNITLVHV